AGAAEPGAPEPGGGVDPRGRVVDVLRRRQALGPRQRAPGPLTGGQHVPRAHAVALDAEREVGAQPQREARPRGVGGVTIAVEYVPVGRRAAVVERRLAYELDLDLALDALDRAHQHVL